MTDIRKEKTPVAQLDIGMFVCELDRPWLGTPFMLEGLLIEDDEQIQTMASLCEFVYVDRTVSVGQYFTAPPKEQVAIKRDSAINRITISALSNNSTNTNNTKPNSASNPPNKVSFFDILKEIKTGIPSEPTSANNNPANTRMYNVRSAENVAKTAANSTKDEADENTSLTSQIKSDFTNFISGLTNWGGKSKKLGASIDKEALKADLAKEQEVNESTRITIFDDTPPVEEEIAKVYPVYEKSQIATRELFESLAMNQEIDLTNVNEALDGMVESIERNPDALIWLAKLKQTDDYAYNHAMNVSIMLMALASFMALSKKQIKDVGLAGLLQDIGKAKIPHDLLHKSEKITAEELSIFKMHVEYALEVLEATENLSGTVILTVSQHHERIDGSGYPYKLFGKQLSLTGQMAGLIDTYCALTTNKVYAKGVYNQVALEEIHTLRDIKFNGALIDQLVQFLGMYPVSSLVELNSGEVGVVIQQNSVRRLLPRVMILLNPDKSKNEYPATIDLISSPATPTGEPYSIVRGLPPDSYGLNPNNYYG
ncbi:MAG: HD domain-containing phosphohydrolase [Methylotenera sp.]